MELALKTLRKSSQMHILPFEKAPIQILGHKRRGKPNPNTKILITGGGITNFTNVAATFKPIIKTPYYLQDFVCCGSPNYQEGLKAIVSHNDW